jgi:hypothetical protein
LVYILRNDKLTPLGINIDILLSYVLGKIELVIVNSLVSNRGYFLVDKEMVHLLKIEEYLGMVNIRPKLKEVRTSFFR